MSRPWASTADVNSDGNIDLLVGNWKYNNSVAVFFGDGHGNLGTPTYLVAYRSSTHPVAADLNRDGIQDLVIPSQASALNAVDILIGR